MLFLTNIDLNQNEIQNFIVQNVATLPQTTKEGQIVYNSTDKYLYKFNGSKWVNVELPYVLPIASNSELGGIKIGEGLEVLSDGKVNVVGSEITAGSVEWGNVTEKPQGLVIDESYVHTDNNYTTTEKNKLSGIASGAEVNVQSDWNESNSSSDAFIKNKPTIPTKASDVGAIPATDKGFANGVAELDENGLVPSNQLPSYVDDVLEFANRSSFPQTGESGKIYVAQDTNLTYRWTGTTYVEISKSLALGETSSTAFRGDRGKTAYDHSQLRTGNPHNVTLSDLGISLSDEDINELPDLINNLKLVKITEGTLATTATTKTLSVTGGKIFSVMVYDSVTYEEVITDKKYNSARSSVTITVAEAPENTLKIVVSYIMS